MAEEPPAEESEGSTPKEAEELGRENQYSEILPPQTEEVSDQVLQLWTRCWSFQKSDAIAFLAGIDPVDHEVVMFRIFVASGPEQLGNYNPRMDAREFERRLLERDISEQPAPETLIEDYHEKIIEQFEEGPWVEEIRESLQGQDEDSFHSKFEEFLRNVFDGTTPVFQARGQLITRSQFEGTQEVEHDLGEDLARDIGETIAREGETPTTKSESREEQPEESKQEFGPLPDPDEMDPSVKVALVTTPGDGIVVTDLQRGQEVMVRIVGDAVRSLPPNLLEDNREIPATIPLEARVVDVKPMINPPEDFEADPDDYRKILVRLQQEIDAEAMCFKEEKIKLPEEEAVELISSEDNVLPLIIIVMLLLTIISILAVL